MRHLSKIIFASLSLFAGGAWAQGSADYGSGLKLPLNQEGNKYVRFIFWNQFWAQSIDNNPGTVINGEESRTTMDFGARRMRLLAYAQISPRYLILVHAGINNQSFSSGGASGTSGTGGYGLGKKPQLFFHDVWNEYAIIPTVNAATQKKNDFNLYLGAGLHYWNGISRMTSASTLNFLMVDAPIFNWPTIENSDQFARQFGLYAKGGYKKLHYQFHLNKPFVTSQTPKDKGQTAVDNNGDPKAALGGYVDYQFLDQESQLLPYRVGTYLGTKKVFNIGAGFYHNTDGTKSSDLNSITRSHDINLFGADVFADIPLGPKEKNMALTAYGVYYNFNFGPNYLRTTGILNPGAFPSSGYTGSDKVLEGAGNSRVLLGTGSIYYAQAGFLLPKFKGNKLRIQPIASVAYKDFEALKEAGAYWDAGANVFLDGHHAKLTAQYSSRPLYDPASAKIKDRKGEMIVQLQVYL